ncbi:hypothetical protein MCOR25_004470 [Pyricularia grisea]|nr:hypothetical protein MCOR25_004470 [Pyricularia grisea]
MTASPTIPKGNTAIDPRSLQEQMAKYAQEAAKRVRPDGNAQFQDLHSSTDSRICSLAEDPWADHAALDAATPALEDGDHVRVLVLGAGIGGILSAVRLSQKGFGPSDVKLVDGAGGIGGTWYWNRYPGLHCDVEASVYMPLLEEMDYMPSRRFAPGCEIRTYLEGVTRKFGFQDSIMYRTHIDKLVWDDEELVWQVEMTTRRGSGGSEKHHLQVQADFVILASGLFPVPKAPKLDGLSSFGGQMFHTSRWDYEVTGGSGDEPFPVLEKLQGKRVGIVGTGATAVQVIPVLAKHAAELFVFQRTPSQVFERGQHEMKPEQWRQKVATGPGWQKRRQESNARWMASGGTLRGVEEKLVDDEWSDLDGWCSVLGGGPIPPPTPQAIPEYIGKYVALELPGSERARARVDRLVEDTQTAEKLKHWYPTWCKRPTFHDEYLQTYNQSHVLLVDTDGKGVERVTEKGVVVAGTEYPVDVLVLSTGYRAVGASEPSLLVGLDVIGRGGQTLTQKWKDAAASLHGVSSHGFPNLFWLGNTQAGTTVNFSHVLAEESLHIAHIVSQVCRGHEKQKVVVEVTREAEEEWTGEILKGATYGSVVAACPPSLLTSEGDILKLTPEEALKSARASPLSHGLLEYVRRIEAWRSQGEMQGLKITTLEGV